VAAVETECRARTLDMELPNMTTAERLRYIAILSNEEHPLALPIEEPLPPLEGVPHGD